jgi:hypothetical protein
MVSRMTPEQIEEIVSRAVTETLASFGFEKDERKELKADFSHLRRWRKSVEQAQSYTFRAVITVIIGGFVGALWMGIKAKLGQ